MIRTVFQIVMSEGHYALEAGMDLALAEQYGQADGFDETVWERIEDILSTATGIIVTQ